MMRDNDKKIVAIYFGLALLFIYPLINAGVFYRDDLDRAVTGQYGWRGLGRPVADLLMKILSASGHYNLDLFPYTMIASCLFIAGASLLLSKHLTLQKIPHAFLISSLLIFNPFILQNIAYRYDSFGMAIAFFLAVFTYTYKDKKFIRGCVVKILTGVLSLTLYQSCANIFIGMLAIDVMVIAIKNKNTISNSIVFIFKKTLLFLSFYASYLLAFPSGKNSRAATIPLNKEGSELVWGNILSAYKLVSSYFYKPSYLYFLIPTTVVILSATIFYYKKKGSLNFIIFGIFSILIFTVSLMGPTIFLQEAPIFPRTIVSFSTLLVIIAIPVVIFSPSLRYITLIPVITAFAFSAQLSSALKSQQEYESFVFGTIARDIAGLKDIDYVSTAGHVSLNPRARLAIENKPLIGYFLSPATQFLASFQLIDKGIIQTAHGYNEESDNKKYIQQAMKEGIKPDIANAMYSIYVRDHSAIVNLDSRY